MAEALTPDDYALFLAHMERFPNTEPCPVCRTRGWMVIGLEAAVGFRNQVPNITAPSIPVVQVMCTTCFHLRSFAWLPIQREAGRDV